MALSAAFNQVNIAYLILYALAHLELTEFWSPKNAMQINVHGYFKTVTVLEIEIGQPLLEDITAPY